MQVPEQIKKHPKRLGAFCVLDDVPVYPRGRMTAGGLIDVPNRRAPGRHTPRQGPRLLPIRTGVTRVRERGKHATAERTGPCASNQEDAAEPSLKSGPPFLSRIRWRELAHKTPECPVKTARMYLRDYNSKSCFSRDARAAPKKTTGPDAGARAKRCLTQTEVPDGQEDCHGMALAAWVL